MAQILYSDRQIGLIRDASRIVVECLRIAKDLCVPGSSTRRIDEAITAHIRGHGGTSPFFGYELPGKAPFPAHICASVNEVVVHGLPDETPFRTGDLISIDCGVRKNGYIGDSAWTFPVGSPDPEAQRLLTAGEEALYAGINVMRPRGVLGETSRAIQTLVEGRGYTVVRDYVGHGVGLSLHEEPQVPNYIQAGQLLPFFRTILKPGMVMAIEPMVNEGVEKVVSIEGQWPVKTADGKRSVHFEHTVAVMPDKVEILTWPPPNGS